MKVVVAYCQLLPATKAALERDGIAATYVDTSADDEAQWRLFRDLWAERETFVHLDQDKVPVAGAVAALWDCERPWCAYPVPMHQTGAPAGFPTLCCTKFNVSLMERWSDLMERVRTTNVGYYAGRPIQGSHYRRLDMAIALWVHRRAGPIHWHPHGMVEHRHQNDISHRSHR